MSFFKKWTLTTSIFFLFFFLLQDSLFAQEKSSVFVSILPQKYFVNRIAKNLVNVQVLVKPGANPATYAPSPLQMTSISKAKVFFSIGVPFEKKWLPKIERLYPKIKIVKTDQGIKKIPIHKHDHDHSLDHHREVPQTYNFDPHIWLSPTLVMIQARQILLALQFIDPKNKKIFEQNYKNFMGDLVELDIQLMNMFNRQKQYKFMVFHPSWGYFAKSYGLLQFPIEIEGKEIRPSQLGKLIKMARANNIRVVFAQPQFSSKSAKLIAREIGGKVVFMDPLAHDWKKNLINVAGQIKQLSN